jgi:prepilin-type N-terminal cleavage/methylation domain-containing protein
MAKGFTLLELMVVIAAIAILATISVFSYGRAQASARDSVRKSDLRNYRVALEKYVSVNGIFPIGGSGVDPFRDFSGPTPTGIFKDDSILLTGGFMTAILRDPINKDTDLGGIYYRYLTDFRGTNYVLYAHLEAAPKVWWLQHSTGDSEALDDEPTSP